MSAIEGSTYHEWAGRTPINNVHGLTREIDRFKGTGPYWRQAVMLRTPCRPKTNKIEGSASFTPAYWDQSSGNLLHASFRSKQIVLRGSVPCVLNLESNAEIIDVFPRRRRHWDNLFASAQDEQICETVLALERSEPMCLSHTRFRPDQVEHAPALLIDLKLALLIQYLASFTCQAFIIIAFRTFPNRAFDSTVFYPWLPPEGIACHEQHATSRYYKA